MSKQTSEDNPIASPVLDQERQQKALQYSRIRRRLGFLETGLSLILLLALILTGASQWLAGLFDWPPLAVAVVYFLAAIVGYEALTAPLSYYSGFVLPHRFGMSKQKLRGWLADRAKGGAIGLVLGSAAIAVVYWFLLDFPDFWWLLAWGLMLIVSILMSLISPIFLVPLFYKVKPLMDTELKSRLQQLADRAGAKVHGIFVLDFSSKVTSANAALMGLGRTRRIVLSDTLIQQYTVPEVEVVTAHEIGHHQHRDILRSFVIQAALSLIIFKIVDILLKATISPLDFSGIADPAALPLLILLFGAFSALTSPLTGGFTRHIESKADGYALQLTDDPQAFIDAMTRLANQNLAVAYPKRWEEILFYDHPSYNRRVEHARQFLQKESERSI